MFNERKVLDVHAHVSAPMDAYGPRRTGIFRWDEDDVVSAMAGHVAEIDSRNIDVQILGPRPFLGMAGWQTTFRAPGPGT